MNRVSEAKKERTRRICLYGDAKFSLHVHAKFACTETQNLPTNQTNINQTNLTRLNDDNDTAEKLENIQSGTIAQTLRSRGFKLDQIQISTAI